MSAQPPLPELEVSQWFNTNQPLSLAAMRGKVVLLHAFQMLCPGCVSHAVPQAERVFRQFRPDEVAVIGLHTVFEHHAAMTPVALRAFLHEYRVTHPVGVDQPQQDRPIPTTMQRYGLRGTPSLMVIDPEGRLRMHEFGRVDDLRLGALLGTLVGERAKAGTAASQGPADRDQACQDGFCRPD